MKIWLDDLRPAPEGYVWCRSVNEAIRFIKSTESESELIDCDHDLGDYAKDGGDGIKLLDWLAEQGSAYDESCRKSKYGANNQKILEGLIRR